MLAGRDKAAEAGEAASLADFNDQSVSISAVPIAPHKRAGDRTSGPILQASGLTKRYGGLLANSDIDFTVNHGELRGVIGPNGAGKSTFFKMLTCEIAPTSGNDHVPGP